MDSEVEMVQDVYGKILSVFRSEATQFPNSQQTVKKKQGVHKYIPALL